MRRSADPLDPDMPEGLGDVLRDGLMASVAAIGRNPVAVGGTTAFLVAMFYVSANAMWYQPHFHDGAFFATRPATAQQKAVTDDGATRIVIERDEVAAPPAKPDNDVIAAAIRARSGVAANDAAGSAAAPAGDATVAKVQGLLADLHLYDGPVDGIAGPHTQKAVQAYQQIVGLETTGKIDASLLEQLGTAPKVPKQAPPPAPRPDITASVTPAPSDAGETQVASLDGDPRVKRIQAGLKAFGNDGIELDGVVGPKTSAAIKEFQALFGLPQTGQPDEAVTAKMREIGLTD